MLLRIPRSARCVQRFNDSLNSAIHITYRISLRSSSMREPRDPLLKVVKFFFPQHSNTISEFVNIDLADKECHTAKSSLYYCKQHKIPPDLQCVHSWKHKHDRRAHRSTEPATARSNLFNNDPSAGSPTETLLRLLLPLNDQV